MPYLIDLFTRDINETDILVTPDWKFFQMTCKRPMHFHPHLIELEEFPVTGLYNKNLRQLVVQDRNEAFDVEYYLRGQDELYGLEN